MSKVLTCDCVLHYMHNAMLLACVGTHQHLHSCMLATFLYAGKNWLHCIAADRLHFATFSTLHQPIGLCLALHPAVHLTLQVSLNLLRLTRSILYMSGSKLYVDLHCSASAAECCSSQIHSTLPVITSRYLDYICPAAAAAGPRSPAQIHTWQNDLRSSQMEILKRCNWRVHLDFDADLIPALQQLQQTHTQTELQSVIEAVQASSTSRRDLRAQMQAQAAHHAQQQARATLHAQQAQLQARARHRAAQAYHIQYASGQQQHTHGATCCQSSTKPVRSAVTRTGSSGNPEAVDHSRLNKQAEDLRQSSLNGRYWQTGSADVVSEASQMSQGHRSRYRAVRAKCADQN